MPIVSTYFSSTMNLSVNSGKSEFSTITFQGRQHDAMSTCRGVAQDMCNIAQSLAVPFLHTGYLNK